MAPSKAPDDPETLDFEATVEAGGQDVVLSETYFYPEGGGQPADRGTLGGLEVLDVQSTDDGVVHVVDGTLEAGDTVEGAIDPEFRRYCRRAHTASHALFGAGRRLFDDLGYGGFGITPEKVRVDLTTPTPIDDETLVELERLVNRCVWESREVSWERLPREDVLGRDDVAFNAKTEEGIAGDTVRVVDIAGWDVAACGGTHVRSTEAIGPVTLLDRSNPGEGLTRIEFAVGPEAIDRRAAESAAALEAAETLDTNVASLPGAVEGLRRKRDALMEERDALEAELLSSRVDEFAAEAFERDGATWAAGVISADVNSLADQVEERPDGVDVLVLATPDGQLAVGAGEEADADDVVDSVTGEFGGGGGGSQSVAQAGGLSADGEDVVAFLRGN